MTRGKAVLLQDKVSYILETTEFNGDMGIDMNRGEDMVKLLKKVKSENEFRRTIVEFNKAEFGYPEELFYERKNEDVIVFNMNDYFEKKGCLNWFSDYLYFLNLKSEKVKFVDIKERNIELKPTQIGVFKFGKFIKSINQ